MLTGGDLIRAARARLGFRGSLFYIVLALVSTAVAVAVLAASCSAGRANQVAQNQRVLRHACKGLLPAVQLERLVSLGSAVSREEYGTMLDRGQESRALLECALSWEEPKDWESSPDVRIRAEAALGRVPASPDLDGYSGSGSSSSDPDTSFGLPLPASADGFVQAGEDRVFGSLTVACPNGLRGRVRKSEDLQVSVSLPAKNAESLTGHLPKGSRLLAARTAVRVADWVSERQGCGSAPLARQDQPTAADGKRAAALCSWLDPKALGFVNPKSLDFPDKRWKVPAERVFSWRQGGCSASGPEEGEDRGRGKPELAGVDSHSWSGIHGGSAYRNFADNGAVPGSRRHPRFPPPAKHSIRDANTDASLALWAESKCDGGLTFHRLAVSLDMTWARRGDGSLDLSKNQRKQLSGDVRHALDRYLSDSRAWPKQSHCRDTKLLGEVEEWQQG